MSVDVPTPGMPPPRRIAPDWVAADISAHTEPSDARAVSVHESVANLAVDAWDHLLMVANPTVLRGPSGVGLSASGFATVRTWLTSGAALRYAPGALAFARAGETMRVDLGGPAVSFAPPDGIDFRPGVFREGLPAALAELRAATAGDLCSALLGSRLGGDPFAQPIVEAFPALIRALDTGDERAFVEAARRLVGLGYGSTPTGDDLIHGALIAVHYLNRCMPAKRAIPRLPNELSCATTRLGAHMIEIGTRGLTPEPVRSFLLDLLGGASVNARLRVVSAMGADTGRTIAVGAVLTIAMLLGQPREGEGTA